MLLDGLLDRLRCPQTGQKLLRYDDHLATLDLQQRYAIIDGIPRFAKAPASDDARMQQEHYDRVAEAYVTNLTYPHTQEYMAYLDDALRAVVTDRPLGDVAEICCGAGEAFYLFGEQATCYVGIDVPPEMLARARAAHSDDRCLFLQGDATNLPLGDSSVDTVFMLGGIHHVNDRSTLFREVARILRPGGSFYFREPLDDFFLWRWIRKIIYRLSPALNHQTERPLRRRETVPLLEAVGLQQCSWRSFGFLGFCIFMNSDVLVFNRLFRFVPAIRSITRLVARTDDACLKLPGLRNAGLQVIGATRKN